MTATRARQLRSNRARIDSQLQALEADMRRQRDAVVRAVAVAYRVRPSDILGRARPQHIADARAVAMWLLRQRDMSTPQIGRLFDRDHTTVGHAVTRVDRTPTLAATAHRLHTTIRQHEGAA